MMNHDKLKHIKDIYESTVINRRATFEALGQKIIDLAVVIAGVLGSRHKILIAGNGGSAADASHFAAEFVVRLSSERNRQALPAISLSADPSVLTATGNDYGFEQVFARQVEALGVKGDMLIVLSTSGNSPNLVRAVMTARDRGLLTVGLLGGTGGKLATLVDRALIVPHPSTQRIQEEQILLIHTLVELVESDLMK
jgi:D-sedoheptulose 7-phosphate isomerase